MKEPGTALAFGLEDRPPLGVTLLAALQHLLGVFVSVASVPVIISGGMGLSAADTRYMVGSSLVVSGVATLIQVTRPGGWLGSGLLSVQGTSFAFVGPFIYLASLAGGTPGPEYLGALFGSSLVGALGVMVLSRGLHWLQDLITPTVAGCTILVIGVSLVMVTAQNTWRLHEQAVAAGSGVAALWIMVLAVVATILAILRFAPQRLRINALFVGLGVGVLAAGLLGALPTGLASIEGPALFMVDPLRFPHSVDASMLLVLLPIYLVSSVETMGDLSATSMLSGRPIAGPEYWQRLRGGVLADGFNSLLAALCCTFPNTTFSQNNGVIRVTGVASRRVGVALAVMLTLLGLLPQVAQLFLLLPGAVINGVTGVMFAMVGLAGIAILRGRGPGARVWVVAGLTVACSLALSWLAPHVDGLSAQARSLLAFPIASAVVFAVIFDLVLPGRRRPPEAVAPAPAP
ncbi:MAG TPA: solute carrier family 23 protein [Pseudomonadales bacterium]|nr:solute carrier family 23 protein [Pseudomonadales bacterium]